MKKDHNVDYTQKILEVKDLHQYFSTGVGKRKVQVKAVDGVSFDIYKREVFGLVGESGCGKTTTGRSILKLYEPTAGKIIYKNNVIGAGYQGLIEEIRQKKREIKREIRSYKPYSTAKYLLKEDYKFNKLSIQREKDEFLKNHKLAQEKILKSKANYYEDIKKLKEEYKLQKLELTNEFNNNINAIKSEGIIPIIKQKKQYVKFIEKRFKDKVVFVKELKIGQSEKDDEIRSIREDYENDIENIEKRYTEKLLEYNLNVSDYDFKKELRTLKKAERINKKQRIKEEKIVFKNKKDKIKREFLADLKALKENGYDKEAIQENLSNLNQKRSEFLLKNNQQKREIRGSYREKRRELRKDYLINREKYEPNQVEINKLKEERAKFIEKKRDEIRTAKRQNKLKESSDEKAERLENLSNLKKEYQKNINDLKETYINDQKAYKKAAKSLKKKYLEDQDKIQRTKPSFENYFSGIQTIFQDPISSLNPRMVVVDIISEGLVIRGEKNKNKIREKVYDVLQLVGLDKSHATRYPHEFSGGQRQRIGIARAIIVDPDFIIADEPISALDVSIQAQVINLLNDLKEELDLTILFIAHDLSVVKYFCDRIGVMFMGKIVELAPADDLFAHPLHPYTKSLLSAIPQPNPDSEKTRKRFLYNPMLHDYSEDGPTMREIKKGHFIYANDKEFEEYKKELAAGV